MKAAVVIESLEVIRTIEIDCPGRAQFILTENSTSEGVPITWRIGGFVSRRGYSLSQRVEDVLAQIRDAREVQSGDSLQSGGKRDNWYWGGRGAIPDKLVEDILYLCKTPRGSLVRYDQKLGRHVRT